MTPYEDKTIKDALREEKAKLKELSLKDKIWYIGEYYKVPIIGIIIGIILLYAIGSTVYYNQKYKTVLSCTILNCGPVTNADTVEDYFNKGFGQSISLEKNQKIEVDTSLSLTFDESSMTDYSYAELMKISTLIAGKELDVMIANPEIIDHYGAQGGYADLKELLSSDLYDQVKDHLYTVTDEETGRKTACGLRIDDTDFLKKTGLVLDRPILSIMCNSTHIDTSVNLIRYVFGLQAETPVS